MVRGGAFNNNEDNVRASARNQNEPANRNNNKGFRCVRDAGEERSFSSQRFAASFRRARATPHPNRSPDDELTFPSNINRIPALW